MRVVVVVVVGLSACFTDVAAVDPLAVTCASSSECPSGTVCLTTIGRCTPLAGRDEDPPDVRAFVDPELARPGDEIRVELVVDEELFTRPLLSWQGEGGDFDDDGGALVSRAPAADGAQAIVVRAVDRGGNVFDAVVGSVLVDGRAPAVINAQVLDVLPPAASLRDEVEGLAPGARVVAQLVLDEEATVVDVEVPAGVEAAVPGDRTAVLVMSFTIEPGARSGPLEVFLTVVDDVGNTARLAFDPRRGDCERACLHIDADAPAPLPVDDDGAVVWRRAPWGDLRSATPGFGVFVADAVEPDAAVFVFSADEAEAVLGHAVAGSDGLLGERGGEIELVPVDVARVDVVVVDAAGNASAARRVRDVEFVAAFGSGLRPNPHVVTAVAELGTARLSEGGEQRVSGEGLLLDDDVTADSRSVAAFVDVTAAGLGGDAIFRQVASDPDRGRVVAFGGLQLAPDLKLIGQTHEWDGQRWRVVGVGLVGPNARAGHSMTGDPRRGVLMTGGTNDAGVLADTWAWDGTRWTLLDERSGPARMGSSMVFTGRRVILWGGIGDVVDRARELADRVQPLGVPDDDDDDDGGCPDVSPVGDGVFNADVFAFGDDDRWSVVQKIREDPIHGLPQARAGHSLVNVAGRVFLFGGISDLRMVLNKKTCVLAEVATEYPDDLWELIDGDDDSIRFRKIDAVGPPGRATAQISADPVRQKMVVAAGVRLEGETVNGKVKVGIDVDDDVWEFDPATETWSDRGVGEPRALGAAAFDLAAGKMLSAGGIARFSLEPLDVAAAVQTSLLDPVSLERRGVDGTEVLRRSGGAFIGADDVAVLFGGNVDASDLDLPANNRIIDPDGDAADTTFVGASGTCSIDVAVIFGRTCRGGVGAGDIDLQRGIDMARPPPREGHAMAYDEKRKRVLMYGGGGFFDAFNADLWELDVDDASGNGAWIPLLTVVPPEPAGPGARFGSGMAFDGDDVLLFGGCVAPCIDASQARNDLWRINVVKGADGQTRGSFELVDDGGGLAPSPRFDAGVAHDPARGVVVVALGNGGGLLLGSREGDTWGWDGSRWKLEDAFDVVDTDANGDPVFSGPEPRSAFGFAADPANQRMLLFGGHSDVRIHDDLWAYDGAWTRLAVQGPPARERAALAVVPATGRAFLTGGSTSADLFNDLWELRPPSGRPALRFDVDVEAAGLGAGDELRSFSIHVGAAGEDGAVVVDAFSPFSPGWVPLQLEGSQGSAAAASFLGNDGRRLSLAVHRSDAADVVVDTAVVVLSSKLAP
ncbi:MAG: kelch repeat-containing protein [Deltaproteobacteria bacterium]|nr:kelch repeat-containing protein [Deltaproteobacteria bacterium]